MSHIRGNEKRVNRLVCVDGFKKRVMPDCDDCYGQSPSFFRNGEKQFIFSQHWSHRSGGKRRTRTFWLLTRLSLFSENPILWHVFLLDNIGRRRYILNLCERARNMKIEFQSFPAIFSQYLNFTQKIMSTPVYHV